MPGFLTVLPLAIVMVAGPQIITAIFLSLSENWRRNTIAFLFGALLSITLFVTVAYVIGRYVRSAGESEDSNSRTTLDVVILLLLIFAAVYVFLTRKTKGPPKWMGTLQTATPRLSFKLGFLLLGIFPTDIVTSSAVGTRLGSADDPWWYYLPFLAVTLLLLALPVLCVLLLGERGERLLPRIRDWMNANSWIVTELVIALFIGIQINSIAS